MNGLRELLVEAAADARAYDVTDRAVRVVRRRRAMVRLVPVAAALLVVAGLLVVGVPFGGGKDPGPMSAAAGLPSRLTPQSSPPMLPEDRGIGRVALAYTRGDWERQVWVLLAEDGSQYRVKDPRVNRISPDGRWLLTSLSDTSMALRDLTGTARQELTDADPVSNTRWSPDSRRLLVQLVRQSEGRSSTTTYLIDVATGARVTVPLEPASSDQVCAVRNSGVLVVCPEFMSPATWLRLVDSTTGRVIRDITGANLGLRPTEAVLAGKGAPRLGPDDRTMYIATRDPAKQEATVDPAGGKNRFVVGYDLDSGQLTERYALPDQIPPAERPRSGGVEFGVADERFVLGLHADGLLLVHRTPSRSDPFESGPVSVELVSRATGTLNTVTLVSKPIVHIAYPE